MPASVSLQWQADNQLPGPLRDQLVFGKRARLRMQRLAGIEIDELVVLVEMDQDDCMRRVRVR